MSKIGQKEILTQQQVIEFFKVQLDYRLLGNWKDRENNSNIEKTLLTDWLKRQGHSGKIIGRVLTRNLPRRKKSSGTGQQMASVSMSLRQNVLNAARDCIATGIDYFISFVTDFSEEDDEYGEGPSTANKLSLHCHDN